MKRNFLAAALQKTWLHLVDHCLSLHPLCFLQPTLLVIAGYSMVTWQIPLPAKVALFAIVSTTSAWLVYVVLMRPAEKTMSSGRKAECSFPAEQATAFDNTVTDHLLLNKTVL
jgi:hypothetical protein